MTDISMCADNECPSRRDCYRHEESGTRPSYSRQAYMGFEREHDAEKCGEFWPSRKTTGGDDARR